MNRALHKMTDEERAEMIAHDKIILADMHQEPDWLPGEAPSGTVVGLMLIIVGIALLLVGAWIAWGAWE